MTRPADAKHFASEMLGQKLITKQTGADGLPCDKVLLFFVFGCVWFSIFYVLVFVFVLVLFYSFVFFVLLFLPQQ